MPHKTLSMRSLPTDKAECRKQLLAARAAVPFEDASLRSADICNKLLSLILSDRARTVLMYYPVRGEVDILPLAKKLLVKDICVAFPISHTEDIRLEFKRIKSLDDLKKGTYGIPEPVAARETVTDFSDCICIVPAVSVDRQGVRMGYGKGYYDRFLSSIESYDCMTVCPMLDCLVAHALPSEATDIKIRYICTEKEVICTCEKE